MTDQAETSEAPARKWQPLDRTQRRIAGVLVEKAKTTPGSYPLTMNSMVNASNQKSNRFPQMQLDEGDAYEACEQLMKLGAIAQIQGDSRTEKYRHLLYDWLGVDKTGIAVMGELLLRGAQTLGELRARAARMEPIAGMTELRPIIDSLVAKELMIYVTPPGRGCIVTHNLYQPQELEKVLKDAGATAPAAAAAPPSPSSAPLVVSATGNELAELREEVAELRQELADLRELVESLTQ
ncbi:DUF480 domain-containing protein [Adhaeretor mobilis]|uniref:DUF480 domain-containing protein n=1 Tax=Adhaeretor mobilis TaxID=1930276 RepID=A0A517N079_9BACT|nr:DUF480 domain-containing protein [Adhaeretor mobilis]QDT00535.1 hypothetical protein HG15A2_38730 [Adhaeretor mobilis]